MKRPLLLCFACAIACVASAQNILTYTNTKDIKYGAEYEGNYKQLQVSFNGNQMLYYPIGTQLPPSTYLYDHQENGWSVYYYAIWIQDNYNRGWRVMKGSWYAVSPDRQTINQGVQYSDVYVVHVYKLGTQHKSIGPMYE